MAASKATAVRWRVIRSLFELLYHNRLLYWLASTIPFAGQWRTWQRLVIPRLAGKQVLETGCGIGTLLTDMAEAGFVCSAVERSPQMVAATQSRLRRRGLQSAVSLQQGSAQKLPFANASFDSVVSTFPTEYIFDPSTLHEIARVLRPGGRLIIVLGATLLPANLLVLPLVALQTLVYGRLPHRESSTDTGKLAGESSAGPGPRGDILLERLRATGLVAQVERVKGPFWEAFLYIVEKSR